MSGTSRVGSIRPEDDPSWPCYGDTLLELDGGRIELDLRTPITGEQRAAIATLAITEPFAVITPHNPAGQPDDAESNDARHRALLERLNALRLPWVRADGLSIDRGHREVGVAVPIDRERARALAAEFGQSAYFWYEDGVMWLVGALVDAPAERLPRGGHPAPAPA